MRFQEHYNRYTVNELKIFSCQVQLSISGRKPDLVERLVSYELSMNPQNSSLTIRPNTQLPLHLYNHEKLLQHSFRAGRV